MPTTVAGTFTAKGVSASIAADNLPVEITFSITGTFSATWQIERSKTPDGSAWEVVYGPSRLTDSAVVQAQPNERFRARCSAFTSGTITYTMSDRAMSLGPQRILGGFRNDGPAWMVPAGVTAPTFGGNTPNLNVAGASFAQGTVGIARWSANATGGQLAIGHSRATVVGDQTALVDADALGQVGFYGSDGVDLILGAWIKPLVTGSPSAGVMPTSITFGTAVSNNVTGVIGDCGGAMACATCHVVVAPDWFATLPPASSLTPDAPMSLSLISSTLRCTQPAISMAPQKVISPSPWLKCRSPTDRPAPST